MTDESDGSPLVAITSISDTTQNIEVLCIVKHDRLQKSIQLGPQETLVTEACEAKTRPGWDLQAVLDQAEEAPRRVAAISISSDGMPGSFAAFGLSRRTKDGRQSFSSIDFADPKMTMSPNTVFTGIPVGAAPLLGEGKFVPELSLANFSDKSRHVTVKFAHTSGATPTASNVADLALEAGTIKHLKLEGLEADPTLQNSFFVGSDGAPGDLLAKLVSVNDSDSETRVVGIFGKDEKEMNNGGNHPWSIEQGNDSTILLFNHGAKPQPFYLLISSKAMQWQKIYTLAPMQTEAISVRQLIEDQTKDDNGKVLPKDGQSGQVGWWNEDIGLGKGRLLLSNHENGMARNFSCSTLRGLCGLIFNPQITTFANGNTVIFASAIAMVCEIYAVNQCNGTADTGTGGYSTSWSSQNSAIASISGPSNQSSVSLYGAGAGSTTANVTISSQYCSRNGGGPANVIGLTCSPSTVTRGGSTTCTVNNAPNGSTFSSWTFKDSSGNTVNGSGTASSWSGTIVTGGTVSVTVSGGGSNPTPTATITVTNRNWHTGPATQAEVANGVLIALPQPPQNTGNDSGLGYFKWHYVLNQGLQYSTINDNGPNQGYTYWASNQIFSTWNFQYEINPDLENTSSTFYQKNCGSSGFISGSNLLAQTNRHEWNSTTQSHYVFYSNSLNSSSNNPGDFLEQKIAPPGANLNTFGTDSTSGINNRLSTVTSDSQVEPYPVNYSEANVFLGNINYAPYAPCP